MGKKRYGKVAFFTSNTFAVYDTSRQLELDNLLLVVAQTGVFIYSAFCIIGSFFQLEEHLLAFLASLATLVQTTLQTAFILDASSRFACTNDQVFLFQKHIFMNDIVRD